MKNKAYSFHDLGCFYCWWRGFKEKTLKKYQCRWTEEVLTNCFKVIQNSRDIFAVFIAKFSVDHSRIYFEGVIYIYYRNL